MSLFNREVICKTLTPLLQFKRFRGKINIQRPRAPHYERAKFLQFTKPYFPKKNPELLTICANKIEEKKAEEDNPYQRIIANELRDDFYKSRLIGFFHMNPMNAEQQFKASVMYKKENMYFKDCGKKTLQMAVSGTPFEIVKELYCSRNLVVFSPEPEIKKMLKIAKKFPQIIFLAGIYEGKFLSKDEILYYQQIPNLEAAQAEFVQTLNSVGNQIVTQLNVHPNMLVSHLQQRIKHLEENS